MLAIGERALAWSRPADRSGVSEVPLKGARVTYRPVTMSDRVAICGQLQVAVSGQMLLTAHTDSKFGV